MVQVQTKISRCRTELMKWSRLQFGNVARQLKEKKKELHRAEQESMQGRGHN
jgi:hypothetical protein